MFSSDNMIIMISGIVMGLGFIIGSAVYVNKLFVHQTRDVLVRFILMIFASLVALFIVDKVIAFQIKLLTDEMSNQLFDMIKTLTLMIFSYYFGTQKTNSDKPIEN